MNKYKTSNCTFPVIPEPEQRWKSKLDFIIKALDAKNLWNDGSNLSVPKMAHKVGYRTSLSFLFDFWRYTKSADNLTNTLFSTP